MGELLLGVPLLCGESERDQLDKVSDTVSMCTYTQPTFNHHRQRSLPLVMSASRVGMKPD